MMQNQRKKRTGGICLLLTMAFVLAAMLFAPSKRAYAGAPSEVRESVVMVTESVRYLGTKSYREFSQGSGFFVGNEGEDPIYLVTNHHVIADYLRLGGGKKAQLTDGSGNFYDKARIEVFFADKDSVEAYPVAYNDKADVAILRLDRTTDKRKPLPVKEPDDSMVGSAAYAFGFPGIGGNDSKDAVSQRSKSDVSVTTGLISRLLTQHGTGIREIQTDTQFWHGNSGGPLVLEDGVAIGITANYYLEVKGVEREELNYAVSMAEVIPLLKNNNIPYFSEQGSISTDGGEGGKTDSTGGDVVTSEDSSQVVPAEQEESTGLDKNLIILIVAAGAVLVIILVIIIVLITSKKKKENAGGGNMGMTPPNDHLMGSGSMGGAPVNPAPMGMGAPMDAGPMGGAPVSPAPMGMGAPMDAGPMGGVPPMGPSGNNGGVEFSLSVQGVSGLFAGRTYNPGRDGRIMFGRQPACQVVFGGNDKNISGNHCVLYKQNGGVMLMDIGSTNGTFLENGTRLQPNIAYSLRAGERFYLVNKNYMFMIK